MPVNKNELPECRWNFDNSYARLPEFFFSMLDPTPVSDPEMVTLNTSLAEELGLDAQAVQSNEASHVFAGNTLPEGALPIAQAYAGHQFGHFTMLGDGRAVMLGEHITPDGRRLDIQYKGSGRTPYSRGGDGRAALGPMLREYIISEAMHALGIPTTRSLAVVTTGEEVMRETALPGAILTRVAASHLRFGTFEYASQWGTTDDLKTLADYTIDRHFAHLQQEDNRYVALIEDVIKQTAHLIVQWQLVGFIHGVMNTDNMTLSGETIDYGPCAFMNAYDPETVFSSIDAQGRYAYGNQPKIAGWNLARFAETLLPLLADDADKAVQVAQEAMNTFGAQYEQHWLRGMRAKLGITNEEETDAALIHDLLQMMQEQEADFTNTFRALTLGKPEETEMHGTEPFEKWFSRWQNRLERQGESSKTVEQVMRNHNPAIIPRNHRVEEALQAAVDDGDLHVLHRFLDVLADPYAYTAEQEAYTAPPEPSVPYQTFCGT